jgi:GTPase
MFVDKVIIEVQAGRGGDGAVSFLREAFRPRGGPDGGVGGDGGSVILRITDNRMTLRDVGSRRHYKAQPGQPGRGKNMTGHGGKDIEILVPAGTLVLEEDTGEMVADLTEPGTTFVLARGGLGGKGNASFATALNQAPRVATKGEPGESGLYRLELKLIAEVGLVGLPNAGKSTFLSRVTRANPRIAPYPFTTLTPNLGLAKLGPTRELVIADIPGLIEGASEGKGLGDEFLRHVERTRILLHLVDGTGEDTGGLAPQEAYRTIRGELESYRSQHPTEGDEEGLGVKQEIVALNKIDALDPAVAEERAAKLSAAIGKPVRLISGVSGAGCKEVLELLRQGLDVPPDPFDL